MAERQSIGSVSSCQLLAQCCLKRFSGNFRGLERQARWYFGTPATRRRKRDPAIRSKPERVLVAAFAAEPIVFHAFHSILDVH